MVVSTAQVRCSRALAWTWAQGQMAAFAMCSFWPKMGAHSEHAFGRPNELDEALSLRRWPKRAPKKGPKWHFNVMYTYPGIGHLAQSDNTGPRPPPGHLGGHPFRAQNGPNLGARPEPVLAAQTS